MKDIIIRLFAIFGIAKNFHYSASGSDFYGNHLLFDKISENILDFADDIQEDYFLSRNLPAVNFNIIFKEAAKLVEANSSSPESLRNFIRDTIYFIDEASKSPELSEGDKTNLGDISSDLSKKLGFLNRVSSR